MGFENHNPTNKKSDFGFWLGHGLPTLVSSARYKRENCKGKRGRDKLV